MLGHAGGIGGTEQTLMLQPQHVSEEVRNRHVQLKKITLLGRREQITGKLTQIVAKYLAYLWLRRFHRANKMNVVMPITHPRSYL